MVEKLRSAQAGAAFDQDYVKGQLDGHNKLLRIQEEYLASAACAEAIAHGVHSADVVLNILARQRDPAPPTPCGRPYGSSSVSQYK